MDVERREDQSRPEQSRPCYGQLLSAVSCSPGLPSDALGWPGLEPSQTCRCEASQQNQPLRLSPPYLRLSLDGLPS